MTTLIGEVGGTRSTWVLLEQGLEVRRVESQGLHPASAPADLSSFLTSQVLGPLGNPKPTTIWYYGTALSRPEWIEHLQGVFRTLLPSATLELRDDLWASIRATVGDGIGTVAILGTGSNACYYDGSARQQAVPSMGHLFGDEGSGYDIGRAALRALIDGSLPAELRPVLGEAGWGSKVEILSRSEQGGPSVIASVAEVLSGYQDHTFVRKLAQERFSEFLRRYVLQLTAQGGPEIHFTGSVAYHYPKPLAAACKGIGMRIVTLEPSAIEGLVAYHGAQ